MNGIVSVIAGPRFDGVDRSAAAASAERVPRRGRGGVVRIRSRRGLEFPRRPTPPTQRPGSTEQRLMASPGRGSVGWMLLPQRRAPRAPPLTSQSQSHSLTLSRHGHGHGNTPDSPPNVGFALTNNAQCLFSCSSRLNPSRARIHIITFTTYIYSCVQAGVRL